MKKIINITPKFITDKYSNFMVKARRIKDGGWVEGFMTIGLRQTTPYAEIKYWGGKNTFSEAVYPDKIYKCSGITDINGVLIYDGDLIKLDDDDVYTVNSYNGTWWLFSTTREYDEAAKLFEIDADVIVVGHVSDEEV